MICHALPDAPGPSPQWPPFVSAPHVEGLLWSFLGLLEAGLILVSTAQGLALRCSVMQKLPRG